MIALLIMFIDLLRCSFGFKSFVYDSNALMASCLSEIALEFAVFFLWIELQ